MNLQFRDNKFHKRGFLAYALMLSDDESSDDETNDDIRKFNEVIRAINEECGTYENPDRCENALQFAKCCDHVMERVNEEKNSVLTDEVQKD